MTDTNESLPVNAHITGKVKLPNTMIYTAALHGIFRHMQMLANGRSLIANEKPENAWQRHVEGAIAECALAMHLGVYWRGAGSVHLADVGEQEVRTTHLPNGRLILRPEDKPYNRYWLLTGLNGTYEVRGWLMGSEGMKSENWGSMGNGRSECWWVDQEHLHTEMPDGQDTKAE